jgi:glucose/mannose-6-phosphate isomerase
MGALIEAMPEHVRVGEAAGAEAGERVALPSAVVIAGMGGSAMGGELLRALVAADAPAPITRVRAFGIPSWAGPGTLVALVSYSGTTVETIACARQAHAQGAGLLVIASGGELADLAEEWGAPLARVPGGMQPRAALGYLFGALAGAFSACGLAPDGLAGECAEGAAAVDADGARELGARLAATVPLVYGAGPLGAVAYRWKTQFNENAKMHAFSHAFPELAHNEICGWQGAAPGAFSAVFLRDPAERRDIQRRIDVTAELLGDEPAILAHVPARGDNAAARSFNLIAFGDRASYHAALARGIDPTPVERLVELKRRVP